MSKPLRRLLLYLVALAAFAVPSFAQQDYVGLFDVYSGFTYLDSPSVNLAQRGYHLQVGINPKTWYALGFDYSISTGHSAIEPNQLTTALQQQLGGQLRQLVLAGIIPPTYALTVPFDSTTDTFAAGPQLEIRHFSAATLFVRPSIGAIHEVATLHSVDPISAGIVMQLAPSGKKSDWTPFYGFGGGVDLNVSRHFSVRMQADFVHNHLFSDVLRESRNTVRLSIGPSFHFGRNVAQ